jgi:tungstate transport system substrate-binding protein
MKKTYAVFVLFLLCANFLIAKENILRLATTTSTYETGLLDKIIPPFEKENN